MYTLHQLGTDGGRAGVGNVVPVKAFSYKSLKVFCHSYQAVKFYLHSNALITAGSVKK